MTETEHINTEGLLDVLSVDFSRALKELAAVLNDLKRLSSLGDLPITYQDCSLRVHFPGCDAETVEKLCNELHVQRGIVVQDDDFDAFVGTEIALLFPFAPSGTASEEDASDMFDALPVKKGAVDVDWRHMLSPSEATELSTRSEIDMEEDDDPWGSSPSGYESLRYGSSSGDRSEKEVRPTHSPLEYQGIEGIYRFIEQCDSVRR